MPDFRTVDQQPQPFGADFRVEHSMRALERPVRFLAGVARRAHQPTRAAVIQEDLLVHPFPGRLAGRVFVVIPRERRCRT